MSKVLKQEVHFEASPKEVYEALMDSEKHAAFTGTDAEIGKNVGDSFSAWGEYITGKNIELKPEKIIVQSWHASDWPADHYSTAKFELEPEGEGTKLKFTQENIPEDKFDEIDQGWYDNYWDLMKKYFAEQK